MATAHARTAASGLAAEVQDLLRVSNMDRRALEWIGMAMSEIINRMRTSLFYQVDEGVSISINTRETALAVAEASLGSPLLAVFVGNSDKIYCPKYLEPGDFDRLEKDLAGGSFQTGSFPTHWTLDNQPTDGTEVLGAGSIRYFPQLTGAFTAWVWFMGQYVSDSPAGTDKMWLPYHWEHVLVWKAASIGARMKKPQLHQLFEAEAEMALQQMITIMNYRPDQIPILREITGPGDEMPQGTPQFPATIG